MSSYTSSTTSLTASSTGSSTASNPTFLGVPEQGQGKITLNENFFSSFEAGENIPEVKALNILIQQADIPELILSQNSEGAEYLENLSATINTKLFQHFTKLTLWISLSNYIETPKGDECDWDFVKWKVIEVTQLNLGQKKLSVTFPTSIIGPLESLKRLDPAENNIHGSIPEELYQLKKLNAIYLNENQFTDTLSESIGNMKELKYLYLGKNQFHGHIPQHLKETTANSILKSKSIVLSSHLIFHQTKAIRVRILWRQIIFEFSCLKWNCSDQLFWHALWITNVSVFDKSACFVLQGDKILL